ncbi:MAG TPA: hypothetical protein GXZ56_07130 [Bacteroidales bacterium]|jgi:hypothetical protein|nr:hypothetical protein [Bacteroidales bacterium]
MSDIEKIKIFYQDKGRDLKKIKGYSEDDVINRALDKREALEALELFYNLEIPVLGGDVFYVKDNDEIDWTNDNWYIDQLENETDVQFLKRSIEESRNYVNSYNNPFLNNSLFLFDIIYRKL